MFIIEHPVTMTVPSFFIPPYLSDGNLVDYTVQCVIEIPDLGNQDKPQDHLVVA